MTRLNPLTLAALAGVIALVAVLGNRFQPRPVPAQQQDRIWDFRARIGALAVERAA